MHYAFWSNLQTCLATIKYRLFHRAPTASRCIAKNTFKFLNNAVLFKNVLLYSKVEHHSRETKGACLSPPAKIGRNKAES